MTNTIKGIDDDFVIKSIRWTYPQMGTALEVGEYYFGYFESDKQIVQKLHDLEGALTTSKIIRLYESPEEVFTLNDIVIQIVAENFTESLSITQTPNIYDMARATWGSSSYGSKRAGINTGSVYANE